MTISAHFSRSEFACKCGCGFDTVDIETLSVLEEIRQHFGQPVWINSGCRCSYYNAKVGGAVASQHIRGRAADIEVAHTEPAQVYQFLNSEYPNKYGIGVYSDFIHIDTRSEKARWRG